jgi:receptor protein-tyrosine kinase
MTDKPAESLNLIERMAKRLADEGMTMSNAQPAGASIAERVAQKIAAETASQPDAVTFGAHPGQQDRRNASSPAPLTAAESPAPFSSAARPAETTPDPDVKQVRLDFRVLRQNGMITPDNMASTISNEFRGIKRKLLQKVRDPKTRATVNNLIMLTSSLPGEGKTFSSTNLALSLAAERGLRVLLIDADIIRPSVGKMFISPPREGLVELLTGRVGHVSDVVHQCVEAPNLSVIFAGDPRKGSPELISSNQMVTLCRDLSSRYPDRVVILDTPPVLASSEPAILAGYVHQLIMVVSADHADRHQLRKSLEAVSACQNVSLLFNKAPSWNEAEYTAYYGYANPDPNSPDATSPQA